MNNVEQLIIRACKSKDPDVRLRSVYRRFYYDTDDEHRIASSLVGIMASICDRYVPIKPSEIIKQLDPANFWGRTDVTYLYRVFDTLVSQIRLTRTDQLEGLTPPVQFRRDQ